MSNTAIAHCRFLRMPSGRSDTLAFDLGDFRWNMHGPALPAPLSAREKDLIELARIVHEVDRSMPRRVTTERSRNFEVKIPLREPDAWTPKAIEHLAQLLYLQGGVEWGFSITKRGNVQTDLDGLPAHAQVNGKAVAQASKDAVVLFSGGLDSTCGLAFLQEYQARCLLVGAFSRNLEKQRTIAKELGYSDHVQIQSVRHENGGTRRVGGQFQHRSFYYLALGAAYANCVGARAIYQFENGPLALSVPPAPLYRMTRHAHPNVHRECAGLFSELFQSNFNIYNPFLRYTKREAVNYLFGKLPLKQCQELLERTETCWNIHAVTVVGAGRKNTHSACGTCIPCLVRRTSVREHQGYAVDLTSPHDQYSKTPEVRVHLDAYLAFAQRVLDTDYDVGHFLHDIPEATEAAIFEHGALSLEEALLVYKSFASEIVDTFSRNLKP